MLKLRDISFSYPDSSFPLLRDINLTIDDGDIVRITGRNGAGKSTLLKVIAGEIPISHGMIERDREFQSVYLDQFAGDMLAMELTLFEVWNAFNKPTKKSASKYLFQKELGKFGIGLEQRIDSFCGELSGGERQILALCIATGQTFDLLCLDEFTSNLDKQTEIIVVNMLLSYSKSKSGAICFISHEAINLDQKKNVMLVKESSHESH
jgi:ABC-type multidrug transport system ATPase subunit